MAPPIRLHPTALLAQALAYGRARGVPFDAAWEEALPTCWPTDSRLRMEWREAIQATRAEWEAAYEGRPTPFSVLAPRLLAALTERETQHPGAHPGQIAA